MGSADTIFALSSGRPPAAIAVVRVSGPRAGVALQAVVDADHGSLAAASRFAVLARQGFDLLRGARNTLAFGGGAHNCLGQRIARLEAECLLGEFVRRVRRVELAGQRLDDRAELIEFPFRDGRAHVRFGPLQPALAEVGVGDS